MIFELPSKHGNEDTLKIYEDMLKNEEVKLTENSEQDDTFLESEHNNALLKSRDKLLSLVREIKECSEGLEKLGQVVSPNEGGEEIKEES
jgi:hypothetical protein